MICWNWWRNKAESYRKIRTSLIKRVFTKKIEFLEVRMERWWNWGKNEYLKRNLLQVLGLEHVPTKVTCSIHPIAAYLVGICKVICSCIHRSSVPFDNIYGIVNSLWLFLFQNCHSPYIIVLVLMELRIGKWERREKPLYLLRSAS